MAGRKFWALALVLLISALTGCGASTKTNERPAPAGGGLGGALPAPSEVNRETSDPGGTMVHGVQFMPLYSQHCEAPLYAAELRPDPEAGNGPAGMAFAMYRVAPPPYGWPAIRLNWAEEAEADSRTYLGLANFETNRWEFFEDTGDPIRPQGREPYIDGNNQMLAVVIATGSQMRTFGSMYVNPFDPERDVLDYQVIAEDYPRVEHVRTLTLGGNPAVFIAWAQHSDGSLPSKVAIDMVRASDSEGTSWEEPRTLFSVDAPDPGGLMTSYGLHVVEHEGLPLLLWQHAQYEPTAQSAVKLLRALDAQGNDWAASETVYDSVHTGQYRAVKNFAVVNGLPAYTFSTWDGSTHMPYFHSAGDAAGTTWNEPVQLPRPGMHVTLFGLLPDAAGGAAVFSEVWNPAGDVRRYLYELEESGDWSHQEILTGRIALQTTLLPMRLADGRPAFSVKETDSHSYEDLGQSFHKPVDPAGTDWSAEPSTFVEPLPGVRHMCTMVDDRPLVASILADATDTILYWTSAVDPDCSGWEAVSTARLPFSHQIHTFAAIATDSGALVAYSRDENILIDKQAETMDVCVTPLLP